MRIVFLDMDGVMNDQDWIYYIHNITKYKNKTSWETKILQTSPDRVERLNRILEATGAKLVMISTWRLSLRNKLPQFYLEAGINGESMGQTGQSSTRAEEILKWLSDHPEVTSYVVLDDEPDSRIWDFSYFPELAQRWVKTSWNIPGHKGGLQDEHVEAAIRILEENP